MKKIKLVLQGVICILACLLLILGVIKSIPFIWENHTLPWIGKIGEFFGIDFLAFSWLVAIIIDILAIPFIILMVWIVVSLIKNFINRNK